MIWSCNVDVAFQFHALGNSFCLYLVFLADFAPLDLLTEMEH